jgi:creatinine amidohydrolase/Fe(II)-dependent formamide hydrolase-like protein
MSHVEDHPSRFLPYLTSTQIAELPHKDRAVIVLPLASIEQHGPHLPVYTDSIICQEVLGRTLDRLPEDFPIWLLPLLSYGKSNEHIAFAGTMTLAAETLMRVLKEIGASVSRSGFRRLAIVNAHGGNTEVVDFVIRDIREQTKLFVFALHLYLRVATPSVGLSEAEQIYGIHAGDVETSILMHCRPELVNRELAPNSIPKHLRTFKQPPFMGPLTFAWLTEDIAPNGVMGDATVATAAKGAHFLDDAATQTAELLRQIADFRFDPQA